MHTTEKMTHHTKKIRQLLLIIIVTSIVSLLCFLSMAERFNKDYSDSIFVDAEMNE